MAVNKVILQLLNLSYDVGAVTPYSKRTRCPLDINKNKNRTGTVRHMGNVQSSNHQLPDRPGIGQKRLRIVATQAIGWNATLGHADSYPRDKKNYDLR